jgi:hypothetical protein
MTDWNEMLVQLDKKRLKRTSKRWTSAQGLQSENEFPEPNAVPFGMTPSTPDATSFATITKQVNKKGVSKKSKRDRIAEKSVLLADRLEYQTYK